MTQEFKEKIAVFRFSIISGLVTETFPCASKRDYFRIMSKKKITDPYGKNTTISGSTIERWYIAYRKHGLEGLLPRDRNDMGRSSKLTSEQLLIMKHYVDAHPRLPATAIYESMINNHQLSLKDVHLSTFTRAIKKIRVMSPQQVREEMRRYEVANVNALWACDTTYSYSVFDNGNKKRMFIIAIIDDKSRLIVGCDVFFNDNYVNFMKVLKDACSRYGIPKMLNLDNGAPYKNHQLDLLAARSGFALHHCAYFHGNQKAKIERWFRTMKDHFMAAYNITKATTIEQFRKDLKEYINKYNNQVHSEIGDTPNNIFFNKDNNIRYYTQDELDKYFLLELDRKVSIDNVIQINNVEYEVPCIYSNKKIKLRYSADLEKVYVVNPDNSYTEIHLLNKVENSITKRSKPIYNTEAKQ